MSDYHTDQARDARAAQRRAGPQLYREDQLRIWYHVALLKGWETIVREQLAFFRHCGLGRQGGDPIHIGSVGPMRDLQRLLVIADEEGVNVRVEYYSTDVGEHEHPTVYRAWRMSRDHPGDAYMYVHTKGCSNTADTHKRHWRRVMQGYVIGHWRTCLMDLAIHDIACANWHSSGWAHAHGNFWMARGDWLFNLDNPINYRIEHQEIWIIGNPWDRIHCEMWLGSKPGWTVASPYRDVDWCYHGLYQFPYDTRGFNYASYDHP